MTDHGHALDDHEILDKIHSLVAAEHSIRADRSQDPAAERARLARVEEALDQCWDLLRRRKALRESGGNPDDARSQSVRQVEGYLQ